jgi:hypothetical protein
MNTRTTPCTVFDKIKDVPVEVQVNGYVVESAF